MHTETGFCTGCWRTLDEIAAWGTLDDADKQQVWTLIHKRQTQLVFSPNPP